MIIADIKKQSSISSLTVSQVYYGSGNLTSCSVVGDTENKIMTNIKPTPCGNFLKVIVMITGE